jgi:hypothetical protein
MYSPREEEDVDFEPLVTSATASHYSTGHRKSEFTTTAGA